MTTPSVSGTFLSRPEGGMEFGVDYGASGLLGAPVYAPLSGTVVGYSTQQGWAPGRLLISTSQGLLGIGHVLSNLVPGQVINAGQQVGTIGDSSAYGGTPESNAHVEVMLSPSGQNTYASFTSGGASRVAQDTALAEASLGAGQVGAGIASLASFTPTSSGGSPGSSSSDCQSLSDVFSESGISSTIGSLPVLGAAWKAASAPEKFIAWGVQPCKRWMFALGLVGFVAAGIGVYLVFRREIDSGMATVAKAVSV